MSVLFHKITLTANKDSITFFMGGSLPTSDDDLVDSEEFCDYIYDNQGKEMEVAVHVESYLFPEDGEIRTADFEDIDHIKKLIKYDPAILNKCDNIEGHDFSFLMKPVMFDNEDDYE